jgi:hypothetical protein
MNISGISTSVSANSFASSSTAGTDFHRSERMEGTREPRHNHENGHHGKSRKGLALGVFKQELHIALKAHFHARFAVMQQGYARQQEPVTSDDVAEEALGAAKQLVAEEPTKAAKSLISFRAKVEETASYVRERVRGYDDVAEVDNAVAKVDQGLSKLEGEVAANRESAASVLAVDTRSKQRSTIQIRTQEGDIVRLNLKRIDSTSASDVAYSNNEISLTSTEVAVSSRSRMMLKVEGDLNESEMAAIQNVFAQAESIADEFFSGDIGAAFNIAQGFEFDTGQLARVNLGFRMSQVSKVSYAEAARPAAIVPALEPTVEQVPSAPATAALEPVTTSTTAAAPVVEQPATLDGENVAEAIASAESVEIAAPIADALSIFFEQLTAFIRTVGEGFAAGSAGASYSYHYSESFKFNLLKAVVHTIAPSDAENAAENAEAVINRISGDTNLESA